METVNDKSSEDLYISDIVIISGIRSADRIIDVRQKGRPNHGFLYIWNGKATVYLGQDNTLSITKGQLLYIPKYKKYKIQYTQTGTTFVVVNFDMFSKSRKQLSLSDDITIVGEDDAGNSIASIMAKLEICSASQHPAAQFRRKELTYRLLTIIFNNYGLALDKEQRYPQIFQGVLLLKQSYLENLPIEVFAKQSNVSVSTFRTLFGKQYGMSPLQYRNRLRISRAKDL